MNSTVLTREKKMGLRNAIRLGYTSKPELKEAFTYFTLATECGLSPWEVDKMNCVMVEEWMLIINERNRDYGNRG